MRGISSAVNRRQLWLTLAVALIHATSGCTTDGVEGKYPTLNKLWSEHYPILTFSGLLVGLYYSLS